MLKIEARALVELEMVHEWRQQLILDLEEW
jgi:hypothetical protein